MYARLFCALIKIPVSPSRIGFRLIIDTELALSAYKDESSHTEDLISVLIPTGNMTDGMILDSYNVEKLDVSNYRKAFGDALHIGIRITSNHLHPVYNKGDILLISLTVIVDWCELTWVCLVEFSDVCTLVLCVDKDTGIAVTDWVSTDYRH